MSKKECTATGLGLLSAMLVKRRRAPLLAVVALLALGSLLALLRNRGSKPWVADNTTEPPTLVFRRTDLQKIWLWEIASGHYPSHANSPSHPPSIFFKFFFSFLPQFPSKSASNMLQSTLLSPKRPPPSSPLGTAHQTPATSSPIPPAQVPNASTSIYRARHLTSHTLLGRSLGV